MVKATKAAKATTAKSTKGETAKRPPRKEVELQNGILRRLVMLEAYRQRGNYDVGKDCGANWATNHAEAWELKNLDESYEGDRGVFGGRFGLDVTLNHSLAPRAELFEAIRPGEMWLAGDRMADFWRAVEKINPTARMDVDFCQGFAAGALEFWKLIKPKISDVRHDFFVWNRLPKPCDRVHNDLVINDE
jgi:hypothetical protein